MSLSAFFLFTVPSSYGLWEYIKLSETKSQMGAAALGTTAYFAGGAIFPKAFFSEVDIFDTVTQQWTVDYLTEPRFGLSAVSKGIKVLFAYVVGGGSFNGQSFDNCTDTIDVFDSLTGAWSVMNLTAPLVWHSVESIGDKLVVAAGLTGSGSSWFDQDLI